MGKESEELNARISILEGKADQHKESILHLGKTITEMLRRNTEQNKLMGKLADRVQELQQAVPNQSKKGMDEGIQYGG